MPAPVPIVVNKIVDVGTMEMGLMGEYRIFDLLIQETRIVATDRTDVVCRVVRSTPEDRRVDLGDFLIR